MQPRLKTVKMDVQWVQKTYNSLESRVEELLADYDNYVRLLADHRKTGAELIRCCRRTLYRSYLSPGTMLSTRQKGPWPGSSVKRPAEEQSLSRWNTANAYDFSRTLQNTLVRP